MWLKNVVLTLQAPVDRTVVYNLLFLYRSGALNTCPVSFLLQDDVVQPVARLTSEQVAMFTQVCCEVHRCFVKNACYNGPMTHHVPANAEC